MAKFLTHNNVTCSVGDTILVHNNITEGDKTRVQIFEGILIAVDNRESGKMFCVRKIATDGVGVERIFPVDGPSVAKIEVKRHGNVHRAKLHYLRNKIGKLATKIKEQVTLAK